MSPRGREPAAPTWAPPVDAPAPFTPGWLDFFDVIALHDSGGKDSLKMKLRALEVLRAAGALGKTFVLHLWLDERHPIGHDPADGVEWHQVPALVVEQCARLGVPLGNGDGWGVWDARAAGQTVERDAWAGRLHFARRANRDGSDYAGDLLDDIATRRKKDGETMRGWPTMWTRYCTSDWKTAVGRQFTEYVCEQVRRERGLTRPIRVLQIMGFRAEESEKRAACSPYGVNYKVSAETLRHVWEWLPIHQETKSGVWAGIRAAGVPYHPVYDEGMTRLSCRGCIMASRRDLSTMARIAPATHARMVRIESDLDDPFQHNKRLADVPAEPGRQGFAVRWTACPACGVPVLARDWETQRHCPAHAETGPWASLDGPRAAGGCGQLPLFVSGWSGPLGGGAG
jgi:3'-phosphoadenosine 5'-phosphosulfate sulfotransferase (PAPS reductase)/FAD synthetase